MSCIYHHHSFVKHPSVQHDFPAAKTPLVMWATRARQRLFLDSKSVLYYVTIRVLYLAHERDDKPTRGGSGEAGRDGT